MPNIFAENFNQFKRLKISSNSIELVNLFNEGKLDAIVINSDFFTQIQGSAIGDRKIVCVRMNISLILFP